MSKPSANNLSRRQFAQLAAAGVAAGNLIHAQQGKLTAGEVVERIKKHIGIPWIADGHRDSFKIGGPDSPVAGICTTFMANLSVLHKAQKAGLNFVINHETTFYDDADKTEPVKGDPLYKLKLDFAQRNHMAVWRIHDNWHARKPDGIMEGWTKRMGWTGYQVGDARLYRIPPTTLGELAKFVSKTLEARVVKIIGDPNLRVTTVSRGTHTLEGNMDAMPLADCLLVSEAREFDSYEYVRDVVLSGQKKGAMFISHEAGEEAGMDNFAEWIKPFVPEVPVKFIPTTDEFWTV